MRVMIAVAFKQIYCAFINLVFIKARYIIAQITFLRNFYCHLIFRNDFHDCLFIFVSLTPHCQSTYSSPLKLEHPSKCKEFPPSFILYKWQREKQTQALTRMTVRVNSHLIFFNISQILKIYNAEFRLRRAYLSLISRFSHNDQSLSRNFHDYMKHFVGLGHGGSYCALVNYSACCRRGRVLNSPRFWFLKFFGVASWRSANG